MDELGRRVFVFIANPTKKWVRLSWRFLQMVWGARDDSGEQPQW